MDPDEAPPASVATAGRPRRSLWIVATQILLALAVWVSYRTERRIFQDTTTVTVIANVRTELEQAEVRRTRDPRDEIAEIYGVPVGAPLDVVPKRDRDRRSLIQPVEDPTRRLVPLARFDRFDRPSLARLVGHGIALGLLAASLAAYAIARRARRRGNGPTSPARCASTPCGTGVG